jgi:hypothetical protein
MSVLSERAKREAVAAAAQTPQVVAIHNIVAIEGRIHGQK